MEALNYQLSEGCSCQSCVSKSQKSFEFFEKYQDKAERMFFNKILENPIKSTKHSNQRNYERVMNHNKAVSLIEDGFPIQYGYSNFAREEVITILTYDRVYHQDKAKYIPYHFVLSYSHVTKDTRIVSFYRPSHDEYKWQWDETYQHRIYNHVKEEELKYAKSLGKNWEVI